MSIPEQLNDRERAKFTEANSNVAVRVVDSSVFTPPPNSDAGTIDYPSSVIEVIKFRSGGKTGSILKTVTLEYSDATKSELISWEFS